ncbi:MAG: hypothetical protein JW891_00015 [Candidatus Lokiarchaeota archaeon]|nr:hypothetical protein [Candidatus Lokiarchaeota archaeon]
MRHKMIIGWAFVLIIVSLLGLIFIEYPLIVNTMIPVEVVVASSIIPLVYIDKRLDSNGTLKLKKKIGAKEKKIPKRKDHIRAEEIELLNNKKKRIFKQPPIATTESLAKFEEDIDLNLEEVKFSESIKRSKSALDILKIGFPNEQALEIVTKEESLEDIISELNDLELNFFSSEFFESLDEFKWKDDNELIDFVKDMMCFSQSERRAIINDMKNKNTLKLI